MKKYKVLLIGFYFPILVLLLSFDSVIRSNYVNYSILFLLFIILINTNFKKKSITLPGIIKKIFIYYSYLIIIVLFKGLFVTRLNEAFGICSGIILSFLSLIFLIQCESEYTKEEIINGISNSLGIGLLFQLVISIYEAYTGFLFFSSNNIYSLVVDRDIFNLLGIPILSYLGLKTAFTGGVGQHNYFGSMLMFYNIIFLTQYYKTKEKKYLVYIILVILSIIGNTTRIAFIAIILTHSIYLYFNSTKKVFKVISILFFLIFIGYYLYGLISSNLFYYSDKTETISIRTEIWIYLISTYINYDNISIILIGFNLNFLFEKVGTSLIGRPLGSFENQFLNTFFIYGIFALIGLIYIYIIYPFKNLFNFYKLKPNKLLSILFGLNLLLSFVTLDNLFHFSNNFLIVFTFYAYLTFPNQRYID